MKEKLALFGGKPILSSPLPEPHHIGKEEIDAAVKVLKTGKLSGFVAKYNDEFLGGPWVKKLESGFSDYFGTRYAVAMNSATSCLYAAIYALGIHPGDEVIVTPYTMSASVTAVLACCGVPVFVDIDIDNYCIDPRKIESAMSPKTKAMIIVHLFGNTAQMDKIKYIAKKYKVPIIEDCAQAPGASYKGKLVGTFGEVGVFSLNRHKTIQTGEGGVAVANSKDIALRLQLIRNHAEDAVDQMGAGKRLNLIGWNYKMTEIEAAIGGAQIKKLDRLNSLRIKNAEYLTRKLKRFNWVIPNSPGAESKPVYYRYPLRYIRENLGIKRSTLVKSMASEGFNLTEGYVKPIYLQSIYQSKAYAKKQPPYLSEMYKSGRSYTEGLCPIAERSYKEELLLSNITHTARQEGDLDLFAAALEKIENNAESLRKYERKA